MDIGVKVGNELRLHCEDSFRVATATEVHNRGADHVHEIGMIVVVTHIRAGDVFLGKRHIGVNDSTLAARSIAFP